ncbi:RDD family protein [Streptomyces xiaopingdaonensis]|uniref:RDD family protein n=1 Tax=Streptomyces xiaopingdaonensis TaxID=1565415 RepID=UPI00031A875D|nr:RDD family protein [Streptomyces xiaopingdaonensis]
MSEQNRPDDPYRPPDPPSGGHPPPGGGSPYGNPPPPPDQGAGGPPQYGAGGGYGQGPYSGGPYEARQDPLAGMPPLANRGKRLLARIIDAFVVGIPVGIVMSLAVGFDRGGNDVSAAQNGQGYWQQGVYLLVYLVYEGLMLSHGGQTVGKKLMRIRVAMLSNGAVPHGTPAWFRAGIYSLPVVVPCLGFLFWLLNVLFCTWDRPYHQCLHDKGARTVVVETD